MKRRAGLHWSRILVGVSVIRIALIGSALLGIGLLGIGLPGCTRGADPEANNVVVEGGYDVKLQWTQYGIPHIQANDWGSLGFGIAYAAATDGICTLAREYLRVRGEQARFLGPDQGRRNSDVFYQALLSQSLLDAALRHQSEPVAALQQGYVAGYNRFLKDHPGDALPAACRDQPWVKLIDRRDLARMNMAQAVRAGLGAAQQEITAAAPPARPVLPRTAGSLPRAGDQHSLVHATDSLRNLGSNAIAFGRDATASKRGLLLGNPHLPWSGGGRLHLMHLRIPGQLNSMGAGPLTGTLISIGFNQQVAWTQTASPTQRSTLYALQLVPGLPTSYQWGKQIRALEVRKVNIDVLGADGKLKREVHKVYLSHLGPVLMDAELPWTARQVFVLRDANLGNNRGDETLLRLNRAHSVAEVLQALRETQGLSVSTVAADRAGDTLYADVGTVPNIDYTFLLRCQDANHAQWRGAAVVTLRAEPACEWPVDPQALTPGLMPSTQMPVLTRPDFVANSNDSHWLANPRQRLEGYSPVHGAEGTAQSLRTRAALAAVDQLLSNAGRVTPAQLQALINRQSSYSAALTRADVLVVCQREGSKVELDNGNPADARVACDQLKQWDGAFGLNSRGALLWAEFWPRVAVVDNVWRMPFRLSDVVGTPTGINVDSQPVREGVLRALVQAADVLASRGIAVDATLGSVQFIERPPTSGTGESDAEEENVRVGIPGGPDAAGGFSVIDAAADDSAGQPTNRYRVQSGNSYMQVVGWDANGTLTASGVLTYSQSEEPDSPHHADMTALYSAGKWLTLPFTDSQIAADQPVHSLHLQDVRQQDAR